MASTFPVLRAPFESASFRKRTEPRRARWVVPVASLALAVAPGCGASGSGPFGDSRGEVYSDCSSMWGSDETLTIYTWWQTNTEGQDCEAQGGEACAAQSLEHTYEECAHGSVKLVTLPSKNEALAELEANRGQPDGGIVNGKADVCRLVGDDISNPGLANLGTPEEPVLPFLSERTPPSLRNLVTCQGYQFGAILGLHRVNQLFYNTSITNRGDVNAALSERGIQLAEAQSLKLDDLTLMLEALSELGYERPLLLGDNPTTWSRFLIENVMVAVAEEAAAQTNNPVDAYTGLLERTPKETHTGGNYVNMVPFDAALERFEALSRYIQYVLLLSTSILKELNAHPTTQSSP